MKRNIAVIAFAFAAQFLAQVAIAGEEYYGFIESRPEIGVGTWMVGGRSFEVTAQTKLDEDHGPLAVGACADVEVENGRVEEIESEPVDKCRN